MVFSDYKRTLAFIVASIWLLLFFYSKDSSFGQHELVLQHRPFLLRPKPMALGTIRPPEVPLEPDGSAIPINTTIANYTETKPKKILFFTPFFEQESWGFGVGGPELFKSKGCPVSNCIITNQKAQFGSLSEFDAILFHMRNINAKTGVPNQKKRKAHQRYVMMLMESPMHDNINYEGFADFFNWTMTFRSDSDLPIPYGQILPLGLDGNNFMPQNSIQPWKIFNFTQFLSTLPQRPAEFLERARKPKLVAWIVSNCHTNSERETYVKELSKHIEVTILGNCGTEECKDNCDEMVQSNYKFFLSFENSICHEYVTEKFFKRLNQNMLPIVMGGSNYSRIAPPHSFINVRDFESPEMLAKYLLYLNQNHREYLSYFWWQDHYAVKSIDHSRTICGLCQMLHMNLPVQSYHNMTAWWRTDGNQSDACQPKRSFPWSQSSFESIKSRLYDRVNSIFNLP